MRRIVADLAGMHRLAVVGRGFSFPAVLESALKLQETAGVLAHGFSTADFRHGPIAVCGPDTPRCSLPAPARRTPKPATSGNRWPPGGQDHPAGNRHGRSRRGVARVRDATECLPATDRGQQLALALRLERGSIPTGRPG